MNVYMLTIIPIKTIFAQGEVDNLFISILFQGEKYKGVSKETHQSVDTFGNISVFLLGNLEFKNIASQYLFTGCTLFQNVWIQYFNMSNWVSLLAGKDSENTTFSMIIDHKQAMNYSARQFCFDKPLCMK